MDELRAHPQELNRQFLNHVRTCTPCTYADLYVRGCTIGEALGQQLIDAKEDHFLRQELEGTKS